MHRHAGLPLHHEGTGGDRERQWVTQDAVGWSLSRSSEIEQALVEEHWWGGDGGNGVALCYLFIKFLNSSHDSLLQHWPVLYNGVPFVANLLLQFLQFLNLLAGLKLRFC